MEGAAATDSLQALTHCIRHPEAPPPADMEPRRLAVYRRLFFNNIEGFLSHAFPRLRAMHEDEDWLRLARGFLADHVCLTPYFRYIGREFLVYLESEACAIEAPPWMMELAHYEWIRHDIRTAADIPAELEADVDRDGDLADGRPALSPLMCSLRYTYPVHEITPDNRPERAPEQPTWLLVHRDRAHQVRVCAGNELTARLLQLLDGRRGGREALEQVAAEMQAPDAQSIIDGGLEVMRGLRDSELILGARP